MTLLKVNRMRVDRASALLALSLTFPFAASALDQSSGVQVTPLLKTTTTWDGAAIAYPAGMPEVTALLVEIAPGAETGWHLHPVPSFAMVLDGALEITLKDGRTKRLHAGEALAEVIDTSHHGRNVGDGPVRLVVFYAGAVGQPLTVREPRQSSRRFHRVRPTKRQWIPEAVIAAVASGFGFPAFTRLVTVNQSWFKPLPLHWRLRVAPVMPASAIIVSTPTKPTSAKA